MQLCEPVACERGWNDEPNHVTGAGKSCAEVVVTRYEKGIAYVRPFDEMAGYLETSFRS